MANRLSHERRQHVLRLLCEGSSLRSASRVTGVDKGTVSRVILQFGNACQAFLDETLRGLTLRHVEIDEIWTFVQKKQARLTTEERALRHDIGDMYLWTAIDQDTKLLACYAIGKRSADMARRFMVDLRDRLAFEMPKPHASDAHNFEAGGYRPAVQISTDGFPAYPEAVDLAFGPYVRYGQIIKEYRNATMQYTPSEMVGTQRRGIIGIDDSNARSICTSHVERNNLTIRTFMRRFTRLSLGFSKKLECLAAAVGMFAAYYNFVWRTRHTDQSGMSGRRRPPAAMMAGVTDHLWSFEELYRTVIQYG